MNTRSVAILATGVTVAGLIMGCSPLPDPDIAQGGPHLVLSAEDSSELAVDVGRLTPDGALPVPDTLKCDQGSMSVQRSALDARVPTTDLSSEIIDALSDVGDLRDLGESFVVRDDPSDLLIAWDGDGLDDPFRGHFELTRLTHDIDQQSFVVSEWASCSFPVHPDDSRLTAFFVIDDRMLDPDASSVTVHAIVDECAGGIPFPAEDLAITALRETGATVEIALATRPGVEPRTGPCLHSPPTPVTVRLEQPLGDRTVLNSGIYPAAPAESMSIPQ